MSERRTAHPYHMYEAIHQQPDRVAGLLDSQRALISRAAEAVAAKSNLLFAGIGTSYHAAQLGESFLRHLSGGKARASVEQSFELVHYPLVLGPDDALVLTSHRGWKNFSVEALRLAKAAGALTLAVTGEGGGEGMAAADFRIPTCEQELSFAHTKSYTSAMAALAALSIGVAERRNWLPAIAGRPATSGAAARRALEGVPALMRQALDCEPKARLAAVEISGRQRWVFVGAGPNWATAREGALKVKETSYIASEGFETEQFLHGPISEMDSRAAVLIILTGAPSDRRAGGLLRALGEVGALRVVVAAPCAEADFPADHWIEVPLVAEWLSPFVHLMPIQLLCYFVALARGTNPDTGRQDQPQHARAHEMFKL